mmetsp:Transcript_4006/g.8835  ORF Transcript_4006/g.8835 Transcript_4006/m.8835 type:complete len:304 (+) Transcript_4006:665-1576(+)
MALHECFSPPPSSFHSGSVRAAQNLDCDNSASTSSHARFGVTISAPMRTALSVPSLRAQTSVFCASQKCNTTTLRDTNELCECVLRGCPSRLSGAVRSTRGLVDFSASFASVHTTTRPSSQPATIFQSSAKSDVALMRSCADGEVPARIDPLQGPCAFHAITTPRDVRSTTAPPGATRSSRGRPSDRFSLGTATVSTAVVSNDGIETIRTHDLPSATNNSRPSRSSADVTMLAPSRTVCSHRTRAPSFPFARSGTCSISNALHSFTTPSLEALRSTGEEEGASLVLFFRQPSDKVSSTRIRAV